MNGPNGHVHGEFGIRITAIQVLVTNEAETSIKKNLYEYVCLYIYHFIVRMHFKFKVERKKNLHSNIICVQVSWETNLTIHI